MFVGHYGPGFVAKRFEGSIPVWVLFIATQWLDFVWCTLVLLGVNKVQILGGYAEMNPYYMPYDHSLGAALFWSLAVGFAYWVWRRNDGRQAAGLVGAAVFSHWILDFITHKPDLPLFANAFKVGLGLWRYPGISLVAEIVVLFAGIYLYMRGTKAVTAGGRYAMVVFGCVMLAIHISLFFGPPPPSVRFGATAGLVCYSSFAAVAYWLEKKRVSVAASQAPQSEGVRNAVVGKA